MTTRQAATPQTARSLARRARRVLHARTTTSLSLLLLASAIAVTGCGQSGRVSAKAEPVRTPASNEVTQAALASGPVVPAAPSRTPTSRVLAPGESLPPDIEIAEIDTLVSPGEPLLFTVYGTPDVSEVALSDGLGDTQYFYKDPTSQVWRVQYRVPLKVKGDRLALSVKAANDDHRWRRRWVFLRIQREGTREASESVPNGLPDSGE